MGQDWGPRICMDFVREGRGKDMYGTKDNWCVSWEGGRGGGEDIPDAPILSCTPTEVWLLRGGGDSLHPALAT